MLLLSVLGSVVFIALIFCARRFDSTQGTDDDGPGGGGHDPRPGRPPEPPTLIDPPLGQIRARRARERIRS
jgi:hypothetical protein